jgi:hypothetical protein
VELSKANLFCFLWVGNSKTAHKGGYLGWICMLLFTNLIILKVFPAHIGAGNELGYRLGGQAFGWSVDL